MPRQALARAERDLSALVLTMQPRSASAPGQPHPVAVAKQVPVSGIVASQTASASNSQADKQHEPYATPGDDQNNEVVVKESRYVEMQPHFANQHPRPQKEGEENKIEGVKCRGQDLFGFAPGNKTVLVLGWEIPDVRSDDINACRDEYINQGQNNHDAQNTADKC